MSEKVKSYNVDLNRTHNDMLEEIIDYYTLSSGSQGIRKCIEDAHKMMKIRKKYDEKMFREAMD